VYNTLIYDFSFVRFSRGGSRGWYGVNGDGYNRPILHGILFGTNYS